MLKAIKTRAKKVRIAESERGGGKRKEK